MTDYAHTNFHKFLQPGAYSYNWFNCSNLGWTNLLKVWQHRIHSRFLLLKVYTLHYMVSTNNKMVTLTFVLNTSLWHSPLSWTRPCDTHLCSEHVLVTLTFVLNTSLWHSPLSWTCPCDTHLCSEHVLVTLTFVLNTSLWHSPLSWTRPCDTHLCPEHVLVTLTFVLNTSLSSSMSPNKDMSLSGGEDDAWTLSSTCGSTTNNTR